MLHQLALPLSSLEGRQPRPFPPFRSQLLKWIGSKQRFAHEIVGYFPTTPHTYFEPFLGSGAVLGTLAPERAVASDVLAPLIEIWQAVSQTPDQAIAWYTERWQRFMSGERVAEYEAIKAAYNAHPNGADLLFLSRSCYGGVVRFRKADGYMSTPCGIHTPISPASFANRVRQWHKRVAHTEFIHADFEQVMETAQPGDVVYCDPPYTDTQTILYGSQAFSLERLMRVIAHLKARGVYVLLSIDGTKKTGRKQVDLAIPEGLFEHEVLINCGRSMLKRFQMEGSTLEDEVVADRLLLTY